MSTDNPDNTLPNYFVHPMAIVEPGAQIGPDTRVWAFAHVLPEATIGSDCNICDHVFIENDVIVGNRVTIKCGVQLWDGIRLEDDVFIGPNVTFTNDPFPRSKSHLPAYGITHVKHGASIGANATILPNITIGQNAMVGAGAVVTNNVPANALVMGNPARIQGYVTTSGRTIHEVESALQRSGHPSPIPESRNSLIGGAALLRFPSYVDMRGSLSVAEVEKDLPFQPQRIFTIYDVPSQRVRGEHAHRVCHQVLICIKGSCAVVIDTGTERQEILLDSPVCGLHVPPMVWATQYKYSEDAVLVVLASHPYDGDDYIRNYDEFCLEAQCVGSQSK